MYPNGDHPGTFYIGKPLSYGWNSIVSSWKFKGEIIVLIDERTLSKGEFELMRLRNSSKVTIIGSNTSGTDGATFTFSLPGNVSINYTGIGIYNPDGTTTQGVGIKPDLFIKRTLNGIRKGKDEVMEFTLNYIQKKK